MDKGRDEGREERQHELDREQSLLDLDQAVGDREQRELDYQQSGGEAERAKMERESRQAGDGDEFDRERSARGRQQLTQDAQQIARDRAQSEGDERQRQHDRRQQEIDHAGGEGWDAEKAARRQRERRLCAPATRPARPATKPGSCEAKTVEPGPRR